MSARLRRALACSAGGPTGQGVLPGIVSGDPETVADWGAASDRGQAVVVDHRVVQTAFGGYVRGCAALPPQHRHGSRALSSVAALDGDAALLLSGDAALADFRVERALFFDIETTGLPGAGRASTELSTWNHHVGSRRACAGTPLAFLIGTARVDADATVRVDQFLLRQQPDEPSQLEAFVAQLQQVDSLVSFNGKSFDRNVLADRLARNRLDPERLLSLPHLDLLHPSRRLYREALGQSTLDVIERCVLGVQRPGDEVRGAEVPQRWDRYLRNGDPRLLHGVLDHNVFDLLSLLTLGGHLARCVRAPGLHLAEPEMLAAAARLLLRRGRCEQAEGLLWQLAQGRSDDEVVYRALGQLAEHLRKAGRYSEATALWRRMLSVSGADDLQPWRAASIALERRLGLPGEALALVEDILGRLESGQGRGRDSLLYDEFLGRRERLRRKGSALSSEVRPQVVEAVGLD